MKKLNISISIGIPAYNEELNIGLLIRSLLKQRLSGASIKEIIVFSDGSTDNTISIARSFKDKRIKVIVNKNRAGKLVAQNEITKLAKGDVLVVFDADVLPITEFFLKNIIKPFLTDKNVGLVGADTVCAKPLSFFERVISDSHGFKYSIFKSVNKGNNIYMCHGRARAFSRKLYSSLRWPKFPPEDAYSYLFCVRQGFKFVFAQDAKVIFRSPSTLTDHLKQSTRFSEGKSQMEKYFPRLFVEDQYKIPFSVMFEHVIKYLIRKPLTMPVYFLVLLAQRKMLLKNRYVHKPDWDISLSSKRVIYEDA